jgi:phasin
MAAINPQTAAEQARKNFQDAAGHGADVPEAMRAMAEKSVAQTREVYDRSKDMLDASVATLEKTFDAAGQGVAAFNRKILDITQRNVNSLFDLAKNLAGAKKLADVVELQTAYWQKQLGALTTQAEEVRALTTQVTAAAVQPVKDRVESGMDELRKAH